MNQQARSELQFSSNKTNSDPDCSKNKENQPFNLRKNIISFFSSITVEPFLILYLFAGTLTAVANKNFVLEKACRADLNYPEDVCLRMLKGENDTMAEEASKNASLAFTKLSQWREPVQIGIPAIYVLLIGAWTDKTGNRKAALLIPTIGEILMNIGYVFSAYYMTEWPIWVIGFIEIVVASFTGGFVISLFGCISYLADITTPENRTFRMGIFMFIIKAMSLGFQPLSGYLTTSIGYYGVYGIAVVIYIIALLYTSLRIKNIKNEQISGSLLSKIRLFFNPTNILDTVSIIYTSRGIQLVQIILVILVQMVILGPNVGEGLVSFAYTKNVFHMNLTDFTLLQMWTSAFGTIGIAVSATVLTKWLKLQDTVVCLISTVSNVVSSIIYALASTRTVYYIGAATDIFGGASQTAIKSLGTKLVEQENVGKMCSLLSLVDSLTPVIYSPIFQGVLAKCLEENLYLGHVFTFSAIVTSPAFILLVILYIFYKKRQRDIVKRPEMKEMHVYDNEVVSHM